MLSKMQRLELSNEGYAATDANQRKVIAALENENERKEILIRRLQAQRGGSREQAPETEDIDGIY